jgi:hypothetical protein
MSLTVGLAIAGGLLLAAVVAHGAWNARRKLPKTLASTERTEPNFDATSNASANVDPTLMPPIPEKKPGLDALIDVIAHISLSQEQPWASGEAALAALPTTRRVGTKPFAIEGLNEKTRQWETPAANQRYSAFQAGVQLANRSGALNEIEFSEFVQKTTAFADTFEGDCDFPEMREEVLRGRELDAPPRGAPVTCSKTPRKSALCPASCPAAWCCPPAKRAWRLCSRSVLTQQRPWPTTRSCLPCASAA